MTLIYFSDQGHKEAQTRWVQGRLISAYQNSGMGISSFGAESDKGYKDKLEKNLSAIYSIGHGCHYFEVVE